MTSRGILFGVGAALLIASPAAAKEWRVVMVNQGANGAMDFSPSFLRIAPGDTVRFVARDKGHNAQSIAELTPPGGQGFNSELGKDVLVKFGRPGLYGYKCMPHFAMGMVGLVEVGKPVNSGSFEAAMSKLPPLPRARMMKFAQEAR